jgi:hypothetical protein
MSMKQIARVSRLSESMEIPTAVFVPSDDGLQASLKPVVFIDFSRMAAEETGEERHPALAK